MKRPSPSQFGRLVKALSLGFVTAAILVFGLYSTTGRAVATYWAAWLPGHKAATQNRITFVYPPIDDETLRSYQRLFRSDPGKDKVVRETNQEFLLPASITVTVKACGEPEAFYRSASQEIVICVETIKEIHDVLAAGFEADDTLPQRTIWVSRFFLFHELAHAFIDIFNLPVLGREEDAADGLATFMLLAEEDEDSVKAAFDAGVYHYFSDLPDELDDLALWDKHSLGGQRYYTILCLIYGSDPQKHAHLVGEGAKGRLPASRAKSCKADFQQILGSWGRLLAPYLNEEALRQSK